MLDTKNCPIESVQRAGHPTPWRDRSFQRLKERDYITLVTPQYRYILEKLILRLLAGVLRRFTLYKT